jgi:anti-sigma factor RsiW
VTVVHVAERHVSGELLSAFLDDEVDDAAATKLVAHVVSCPACERELAGLRAMRDALQSLPALQAPVLTARMVRRTRRLRSLARTARVAAAAAVVPMLVLVTAYLLGAEVGGTEPTVDVFLVEHLGRTGGGTFPAILGDAP